MSYSDPADTAGQFALPRMTPVVKALLIANLALALPFLFFYEFVPFLPEVHRTLSLDVAAWRELAPWLPVWQLATYGFLHSAHEPMHLLGNLIGLYFFGTWLESLLGARRFLLVYLAGIVLPGLVQLLVALLFGQPLLVVGASGAVLLLVVAMATLRPQALVIVLFVPVRLWLVATVYVLLDLFGLVRGVGGAAHVVHLGGAALGFALAKTGALWWDPWDAMADRKRARAHQNALDDEAQLDALLERIHQRGIASLSESEKAFLKRMSARRSGGL
ncbi:MAG: rhomboid family intramembrane serine protease [Planctomycetes bacterium]|nr:rhomboid family intramembrane serine protease [Planctomycetota bacterium]